MREQALSEALGIVQRAVGIGRRRAETARNQPDRRRLGRRAARRRLVPPTSTEVAVTASERGGTSMATLTALKFDTPEGAEQMSNLLQDLQKQQLITIQDAATVTWPRGAKKPKTRQLHNLAGMGALDGAFWGMLFGLIFFVPFLGLAIGAAMGAVGGAMADIGIDDNFIKESRSKITEGASALFLMTSGAVVDRVAEAVKSHGLTFELIATNLSQQEEDQLKSAFA
jgi:uncharacterized membrane protein